MILTDYESITNILKYLFMSRVFNNILLQMYSQFPYKIPKLKKAAVDNQISDSETKGKGREMSLIQVLEAMHKFLISIPMRTVGRVKLLWISDVWLSK